VRFAGARQQGLTEELATLIDDDFEQSALDARSKAIVAYTDTFLRAEPPSAELAARLHEHMTDAELVELSLGIALFHGFSKLMISLGLEPEHMETTISPTPNTAQL
jgi:alkylhydroperoxidase family enzyme